MYKIKVKHKNKSDEFETVSIEKDKLIEQLELNIADLKVISLYFS